VSQSGVLQLAAAWRRPVLASSGPGPLRDTVTEYGLGEFVEPDDLAAIVAGVQRLIARGPADTNSFARYDAASSWRANIDGLARLLQRL